MNENPVQLAQDRQIEANVWRGRYEEAEAENERFRYALAQIRHRCDKNPYEAAYEAYQIATEALLPQVRPAQ